MYRLVGDPQWRQGRAVNVSRTGVLFEAPNPALPAAAALEFVLLLPSMGLRGNARIQCRGRIVRQAAQPSNIGCLLAATIDAYEFLGISPDTAGERVDL